MFKFRFLSFLFCTVLAACGQRASRTTTTAAANNDSITRVACDTSMIAVLPIDTEYTSLFEGAKPATITTAEMLETDSLLRVSVAKYNHTSKGDRGAMDSIALGGYHRQYIRYRAANGDEKVYVYCFCMPVSDAPYWRKGLVEVCDGGSCFFRVIINLTRHRYEDFATNGYA